MVPASVRERCRFSAFAGDRRKTLIVGFDKLGQPGIGGASNAGTRDSLTSRSCSVPYSADRPRVWLIKAVRSQDQPDAKRDAAIAVPAGLSSFTGTKRIWG